MPKPSRGDDQRQEIAQVAARIMWEEEISDYSTAKRKAARRLGVGESRGLPSNLEVEAASRSYQALFYSGQDDLSLDEMCEIALGVMRELSEFNPHVVGVCESAQLAPDAVVDIHLFAGSPKDVAIRLLDLGWAACPVEREYRMSGDTRQACPGFDLEKQGYEVRLSIFPLNGIRQAPRRALDGKAMPRLSISAFEKRLYLNAHPSG